LKSKNKLSQACFAVFVRDALSFFASLEKWYSVAGLDCIKYDTLRYNGLFIAIQSSFEVILKSNTACYSLLLVRGSTELLVSGGPKS